MKNLQMHNSGSAKIVFAIFLVCIGFSALGQNKEQAAFLNQLFGKHPETVVYQEYQPIDLSDLKKTLTRQKTYIRPDYGEWRGNTSAPARISLSKTEIDFVIAELSVAGKQANWSKGLIRNSRQVSTKEVDSIFLNRNKGYPYFKRKYGSVLYHFSKPVFLRNNTVCVFYKGTSGQPESGGGGFSLYVKDNGVWKTYRFITMWIS
ncbi:hypothetical protein [Flavobacterium selenitireducens]|uniref:hypothetical protein n=1 Tax=Flavobacterium selenitireducens TaxID=2722704 RepID=UPI00168BDDA7|nr:hypothetical protein [Flavobacterium selenitireducens]MBD3581643.1 hypothetical protein [Flavobacterium selenitireducens]